MIFLDTISLFLFLFHSVSNYVSYAYFPQYPVLDFLKICCCYSDTKKISNKNLVMLWNVEKLNFPNTMPYMNFVSQLCCHSQSSLGNAQIFTLENEIHLSRNSNFTTLVVKDSWAWRK